MTIIMVINKIDLLIIILIITVKNNSSFKPDKILIPKSKTEGRKYVPVTRLREKWQENQLSNLDEIQRGGRKNGIWIWRSIEPCKKGIGEAQFPPPPPDVSRGAVGRQRQVSSVQCVIDLCERRTYWTPDREFAKCGNNAKYHPESPLGLISDEFCIRLMDWFDEEKEDVRAGAVREGKWYPWV